MGKKRRGREKTPTERRLGVTVQITFIAGALVRLVRDLGFI
jgi:hypothetical protein